MAINRTQDEPTALYRRLPRGPSGMARADVASNQRARMFGAMIESVAERGYSATTVAHVIGLAGVSRRAFYELFPNKERCFLATSEIVVARARRRVIDAWEAEMGWDSRLHAAFRDLLEDIAEAPKGPRLAVVDALGIGAGARWRLQRTERVFERLLADAFRTAPAEIGYAPLSARAVAGGVHQLLFARLREHREHELPAITDELLDWIDSYRSPAMPRLGAPAAVSPPRQAPPLALSVAADPRARSLGGLLELTLEHGYGRVTDARIARAAGISTERFHRHFAGRDECFLALLEELTREALEAVRPRFEAAGDWPLAVRVAIEAFVEHLLARPALLRLAHVDAFELGLGLGARPTGPVEALVAMLADSGPEPRRGPEVVREAVTGAIWSSLAACARAERPELLAHLVEHLSFIALAPYLGARSALEVIRAARAPHSA